MDVLDHYIVILQIRLINDFKDYFTRHGQVIYENPSPGNREGGITTLAEKSLGCVQKSGTAPVEDVLLNSVTISTYGAADPDPASSSGEASSSASQASSAAQSTAESTSQSTSQAE